MNCENCRNPISENTSICEWCGNDNSNPNGQTPITEKYSVNKKALKYTIYIVLYILFFFIITAKEYQKILIIYIPVILYEIYLYLARKFQK